LRLKRPAATAIASGDVSLNAAFGFCLGSEIYLRGKRLVASARIRSLRTHREAST